MLKKNGYENVLFIGFNITKEFHAFAIYNGYREVWVKPTKINIFEEGYNKLI